MVDWFEDKFKQALPIDVMKSFANIISYNLFQMDGITMCVPYSDIPARVMDWNLDEFERFDGKPDEPSLF